MAKMVYFHLKVILNKSETYTISGDYHCNPLSGLYLNTTLTYAYDRVDAESYMEIDSSKYYIDGLDSAHYEIPTVAGPSIKNREVFSWQANARWSVFPWLLINGQFMTEWNDGKTYLLIPWDFFLKFCKTF